MTRATPKKPAQAERVRPIGDLREQSYEIPLADGDLDQRREQLLHLLDQRDQLKQKQADQRKYYASQLATNQTAIDDTRRQLREGVERRTVQVQDYLTKSNEVITVATATDQVVGDPRTATAHELQEPLPLAHDDGEHPHPRSGRGSQPADLDDMPPFDA